MASQLYGRMVASLPHLVIRSNDYEPYNYTSKNGHVCAMPRPLTNTETAKMAGGFDFFTINQIITGSCAGFVLISLFILMFRHATHFSRPNEQLNILRICCYLPVFAIGCFLEVSFPNAYVYINPWLDFVQAIALCNFFLLMCQFVSPSDEHREVFFAALKVPQKKKKNGGVGRRGRGRRGEPEVEEEPINGLEWYRKMWMLIFQYPAVQALVAIFTAIFESQGVYCLVSSKPYFGHLWLDIIHNISLTLAIMSCLRLYGALKGRLAHHKPLAKLGAFKLLVAITGIIQVCPCNTPTSSFIITSHPTNNSPLLSSSSTGSSAPSPPPHSSRQPTSPGPTTSSASPSWSWPSSRSPSPYSSTSPTT